MTIGEQAARSAATVMVVDDEPRFCQLLERILLEDGYRVVSATSGRQALMLAREAEPQLVLLDVVMPEMDGIETLRRLRTMEKKSVVVMLTAHGTVETAREAMLLGAYDYLTKPFSLELLRSVLREGIEERSHGRRDRACAP
jgi:DNA-binding NtrC family response regulator